MKSNNGILTEKESQSRTKFRNKKQFRTWTKKELERTSTDMQKLLVAIKGFSMDEIEVIRNLDEYRIRTYYESGSKYHIIWRADQSDLDYAISIAPKTFKVKQG